MGIKEDLRQIERQIDQLKTERSEINFRLGAMRKLRKDRIFGEGEQMDITEAIGAALEAKSDPDATEASLGSDIPPGVVAVVGAAAERGSIEAINDLPGDLEQLEQARDLLLQRHEEWGAAHARIEERIAETSKPKGKGKRQPAPKVQ